jgi:UDP-glucuronate 4-epimerase
LLRSIEIIEDCLGKKAQKELLPMQPGDVPATYADIKELEADVGFRPSTPLEVGIPKFVSWYRKYYQCES